MMLKGFLKIFVYPRHQSKIKLSWSQISSILLRNNNIILDKPERNLAPHNSQSEGR